MDECTIYIDEAGDLGINRGTRWFVLAGVLIKKADEKAIKVSLKSIKNRFNLQTIHFRKLHDFSHRAFVVKRINEVPFDVFVVIADTTKLIFPKNNKNRSVSCDTYNLAVKKLLLAIRSHLAQYGLLADIVLSSRGTSRDKELIDYIKNDVLASLVADDKHFRNTKAIQAPEWEMLQIADVCATSVFYSLEVSELSGLVTPCFYRCLQQHVAKSEFYDVAMCLDDDYFDNKILCEQ